VYTLLVSSSITPSIDICQSVCDIMLGVDHQKTDGKEGWEKAKNKKTTNHTRQKNLFTFLIVYSVQNYRAKMANKRKKKQKEADFKKTKFRVGKSLPKGGNETNTSFALKKISIPLQDVMKEKQLTNEQNKDLKVSFSRLALYVFHGQIQGRGARNTHPS